MKPAAERARQVRAHPRLGRAWVLLALFLLLWTIPSFAQGCAMCYTTAAASSKDGQMAIDRAVAVLLAPPLGIMTVGLGMALRYGRKRDIEHRPDEPARM